MQRSGRLSKVLFRCTGVTAGLLLSRMSYPAPASATATPSVRLVAVGDICLARGVERAAAKAEPTYPFTAVLPMLRNADITFGNLECVLSTRGKPVPKKYNFRAHPKWAGRLRSAGFDVLSVANNHTMDYGREALVDTLEHLERAGIVPVGGGKTPEAAHALRTISRNGIRVGFLAYLGMFPPILPLVSGEPWVAMGYPDVVRSETARARKKVDVLIVSVHAGVERQPNPSARQRSICRAAVDGGADLVIGHHPHIVQRVEHYRGKVICYSLGNFVFDPSPTVLRNPNGPWGAMMVARLSLKRPPEVELVPLRVADRQPKLRTTRQIRPIGVR